MAALAVYKARCHRLNRLVAVKILRDDLAQDAELRRRFHDESHAVAMLSHPNIVAVYDVSRSSDIEYIVMELIDGITLKQYMQKKGNKLNWREALHFITQIVKALGHAHSRGIIHRDIKPQNIMVLRDGSVKVTDFGIACLASASQTLTQERWAPSTTSPRSRPEVTAPMPAAISTPPAWCSMRCLPAVFPSRGSPPYPWPSST